jgi:25S rRNA (cytosine2278-C5)-methyltransferase
MSRLYIQASDVLDKLNTQGGLKTLVFSQKTGGSNKRKLYALVCETLKYAQILEDVMKLCGLYTNLTQMFRKHFLIVVLYDMLIGKGIEGGGQIKRELKKHEGALKTALTTIMKERGVTELKGLLPESVRKSVPMPRYARVNTLKDWGSAPSTPDEIFLQAFREEHADDASVQIPTKDAHVPHLYRFPPRYDMHDHRWVLDGHIILQDKSSCFPAYVLAEALKKDLETTSPRVDVIDACAAPGNKTSQIAAFLSRGHAENMVHAFDISPKRLELLKSRMKQAGARNVQCNQTSFLDVDVEAYRHVRGVLLDPSCSGSGMSQRLDHLMDGGDTPERLQALAEFQLSALKHALSFPSASHVVYSTCSIHEVENEQVVANALEHLQSLDGGASFHLVPALPDWPRRGRAVGGLNTEQAQCLVRCLASKEDATNGFFVALFERTTLQGDAMVEAQQRLRRNLKRREKKKRAKRKRKRNAETEEVTVKKPRAP